MNVQSISSFAQALFEQNQHIAFDFQANSGQFVVTKFEAKEDINSPFKVQIDLASTDPDINLHELMDTEARLGIYDRYQNPRFLHGVITNISRGIGGLHRSFYKVTLRPTLWRLTQSSDSRIWQQKSVPEIVKQVLSEHDIMDTEWRLAESHPTREFLTQRQERHLPFITRILAEEGIFYFFEHQSDRHKIIFTDAPLSTPALEHAPELIYNALPGGASQQPHIRAFQLHERLRASSYELNDYTFKNPKARFNKSQFAQEKNGLSKDYALYDFPGRYKDPDNVGKSYVKLRLDAERVDATTGTGKTNSIQLSPGFRFSITDHDYSAANGSQFLLSVHHKGTQTAALEEEASDNDETQYSAEFTTMPARLSYRPQVPAKPVVDGPQIAVVSGPAGEEIYTDEHGRVKVKFPWDRHSGADENASCWIRVSHASAGMNYGHATIPRIGTEVLVQYLDGDIDQPIVTGTAYNPTKKHAYEPAANKTRSYWKDQTHKGEGFNEIRFESEAGQEEVFMHAQKDHNTQIGNNESHKITKNRTKTVGANQSEFIGVNKIISVGSNHDENIKKNATVNIGSNKSTTVGANKATTIGANKSTTVGANHTETIKKNASISTGLFKTDTTGIGSMESVGAFKNTSVGGLDTLFVGGNQITKVGKKMVVEVGEELTFKVGQAQFILKKDGSIQILGTNLNASMGGPIQLWGSFIDLN